MLHSSRNFVLPRGLTGGRGWILLIPSLREDAGKESKRSRARYKRTAATPGLRCGTELRGLDEND